MSAETRVPIAGSGASELLARWAGLVGAGKISRGDESSMRRRRRVCESSNLVLELLLPLARAINSLLLYSVPVFEKAQSRLSHSCSPVNLEIRQTRSRWTTHLSRCPPLASTSGSPHTSPAVAIASICLRASVTDSTPPLLQLWRVPLPLRRLHRRRLPTGHGLDRGRHPAADDPPPPRPVGHHHAAQRERSCRDPVGHRVRHHWAPRSACA